MAGLGWWWTRPCVLAGHKKRPNPPISPDRIIGPGPFRFDFALARAGLQGQEAKSTPPKGGLLASLVTGSGLSDVTDLSVANYKIGLNLGLFEILIRCRDVRHPRRFPPFDRHRFPPY